MALLQDLSGDQPATANQMLATALTSQVERWRTKETVAPPEMVRMAHTALMIATSLFEYLERTGSGLITAPLPAVLDPYVRTNIDGQTFHIERPQVRIGKEKEPDRQEHYRRLEDALIEAFLGSGDARALVSELTITDQPVAVELLGYKVPGLGFRLAPDEIEPFVLVPENPSPVDASKGRDASRFLVAHGHDVPLLASTVVELTALAITHPPAQARSSEPVFLR